MSAFSVRRPDDAVGDELQASLEALDRFGGERAVGAVDRAGRVAELLSARWSTFTWAPWSPGSRDAVRAGTLLVAGVLAVVVVRAGVVVVVGEVVGGVAAFFPPPRRRRRGRVPATEQHDDHGGGDQPATAEVPLEEKA